jgi:hypothetical protein
VSSSKSSQKSAGAHGAGAPPGGAWGGGGATGALTAGTPGALGAVVGVAAGADGGAADAAAPVAGPGVSVGGRGAHRARLTSWRQAAPSAIERRRLASTVLGGIVLGRVMLWRIMFRRVMIGRIMLRWIIVAPGNRRAAYRPPRRPSTGRSGSSSAGSAPNPGRASGRRAAPATVRRDPAQRSLHRCRSRGCR